MDKVHIVCEEDEYVWVAPDSDDSYHIHKSESWNGKKAITKWRLEFLSRKYEHTNVGVFRTVKDAKIGAYEHYKTMEEVDA